MTTHKYPVKTKVLVNGKPAKVITTPPGKSTTYVVLREDGRAVTVNESEMEMVKEG